ncbi:MAG: hypothetical protein Q9216_000112 [Gyalolechia sp. 2 TL-2023]
MAKHTFHLSPLASQPLYNFLSSPFIRLALLSLNLLTILFFSIGVGLALEYIPYQADFLDLGTGNHLSEQIALGMVFVPFAWLIFLLLWHKLKKPKLHPGYYIGFDFFAALSTMAGLPLLLPFSMVVWQSNEEACDYSYHEPPPGFDACMQHVPSIMILDILGYALGLFTSFLLLVLFVLACRVCRVYDREKAAFKRVQKKGMQMKSSRGSSSLEAFVSRTDNSSLGTSSEIVVPESRAV